MKYIMKSVLALLLLAVMLTSCNFFEDIPHTTTPSTEPREEDLYPEPLKQLVANNQPYSLEFTSNGDGTCYLSRLYLNNQYNTPFDVIIPEKSPAGDTVTRIDLGDSRIVSKDLMPQYLTNDQVYRIMTQLKADYPNEQMGKVVEWWVNAYERLDVSEMSPEMGEEIIKKYPVAEYMTIYIWLPKMSNDLDTFLRARYAGITPLVTKQYYEEFLQEAREAGAPEEALTPYKELIEAVTESYVNYSEWLRYLCIPSSVTNINVKSLICLMLDPPSEDERMPVRGVLLPELDGETTHAIYETFAYSLHRQHSKSNFH